MQLIFSTPPRRGFLKSPVDRLACRSSRCWAVLGLDTAQLGTLSAVSDRLKDAFDIGNTQIGLLLAVTAFIGAIATLPMGILADRMRRQTILIVAVLVWAVLIPAMSLGHSEIMSLAIHSPLASLWNNARLRPRGAR